MSSLSVTVGVDAPQVPPTPAPAQQPVPTTQPWVEPTPAEQPVPTTQPSVEPLPADQPAPASNSLTEEAVEGEVVEPAA
jgi:hypothetical protein